MSIDEEREIEKASLLPGRYYIVMRADEENNFHITAYDCRLWADYTSCCPEPGYYNI